MVRGMIIKDTNKLQIKMLQHDRLITGLRGLDEGLRQKWRLRQLVSILIVSREPVKKEYIAECIYGREATPKDIRYIHELACRIRRIMKETGAGLPPCILSAGGCYQWNMETVGGIDVSTMLGLCGQIREAKKMTDKCWTNTEKLLEIYQQAPLQEYAGEKWAQPIREKTESAYHHAISHVLELLWQEEDYEKILHVCQRSIRVMPGMKEWRRDFERAEVLDASLWTLTANNK